MNSVETLLQTNESHSRLFQQQKSAREEHRRNHQTGIMATGCMDDRVNISVVTEMPFGLVKSQRIAGKFDLSQHRFQENVQNWDCAEKNKGRKHRLCMIGRHTSKSTADFGCRAFNYDKQEAFLACKHLQMQFEFVYEHDPDFYALTFMVETDEEALVFDGHHRDKLDLSEMVDSTFNDVKQALRALYPDMPEPILIDLMPLAMGNLAHIKKVRALNRSHAEKDHNASVVAVGTGLDWILGEAYIINPFDQNYLDAVVVSLDLVNTNYHRTGNKPILLASSAFQPPPSLQKDFDSEIYPGRRFAELKVRRLASELHELARQTVPPDLIRKMEFITAVVDLDTRLATVLR